MGERFGKQKFKGSGCSPLFVCFIIIFILSSCYMADSFDEVCTCFFDGLKMFYSIKKKRYED